MYIYFKRTWAGTVYIRPINDRWEIVYREEGLGYYFSAQAAAEDAAGGHTYSPSDGTDLGKLGLPEDIGEWGRESLPSGRTVFPL